MTRQHANPQTPCCTQADPANLSNLLARQPFDEFEKQVLQIARMFFVTFHVPNSQMWMEAFQFAEHEFPAPFGATLANAILIYVESMRRVRANSFNYHDPHCPGCSQQLTDEERYLISVIHHLRQGEMGQAQLNAMLLCEGRDSSKMLEAARRMLLIIGCETPEVKSGS